MATASREPGAVAMATAASPSVGLVVIASGVAAATTGEEAGVEARGGVNAEGHSLSNTGATRSGRQ